MYATLTAIGGILGLLLPETKGTEIPDTLEEAENAKKLRKEVKMQKRKVKNIINKTTKH